jgi:hypothetical protein
VHGAEAFSQTHFSSFHEPDFAFRNIDELRMLKRSARWSMSFFALGLPKIQCFQMDGEGLAVYENIDHKSPWSGDLVLQKHKVPLSIIMRRPVSGYPKRPSHQSMAVERYKSLMDFAMLFFFYTTFAFCLPKTSIRQSMSGLVCWKRNHQHNTVCGEESGFQNSPCHVLFFLYTTSALCLPKTPQEASMCGLLCRKRKSR